MEVARAALDIVVSRRVSFMAITLRISSVLTDGDGADAIEEFNKHHADDGTFTDEKSSECDSLYFIDGDRESKNVSLGSPDEVGRGRSKNSQGKYRCRDGSAKWESMYREFASLIEQEDSPHDESVSVPTDMYACAKYRQMDKVIIKRLKKAIVEAGKQGAAECGLSVVDAIRIIDRLALAKKGQAFKSKE